MNKLIALFLVLTVPALGGFVYMSNKIASLSSLVEQLKVNKIALSDSNRRLEKKNGELENHHKKSKQLLQQHRTGTVNRSLERAAKKMARAGVAMIPVVGISAVVASTADDIHDLCGDIQTARELEKALYGEDISRSKEEDRYCHEYMAEELASMANRHRDRIASDFGISYEALTNQADNVKESMKRFADGVVNAPYQHEFERQYQNIVDYWSGKLKELSDDSVSAPEDSMTLEQTGELLRGRVLESMQGAQRFDRTSRPLSDGNIQSQRV